MVISYAKPRIALLQQNRVPMPAKVTEAFYGTRDWKEFIAGVIKARGRRCEDCGRTGCRIFGDHIKELRDGGAPLDEKNIKLRCGSCHTKKTNEEKRRRAAAPGADYGRQSAGTRPDNVDAHAGLHQVSRAVGQQDDRSGSQDFSSMLEEALSGRAKKRN